MNLTITHTSAEGTLIDGTSRGDGTAEVLKANGWRWGRSISAWYVPYSRDRAPKHHIITATAEALREQGFTVETEIDATPRAGSEVDAAASERADARAVSLRDRATKHHDASESAHRRADQLASSIPFGQPILVGHHSEARHRRDAATIRRSMSKAIEEDRTARDLDRRATEAAASHGARHNPETVGNRIKTLTADLRRDERSHARATAAGNLAAAEHLAERAAHTRAQLTYWQDERAQQIAAGLIEDYGPHNVKKGDSVLTWAGWHEVARVNAKSVTVARRENGYEWPTRVEWHKVKAHRAG